MPENAPTKSLILLAWRRGRDPPPAVFGGCKPLQKILIFRPKCRVMTPLKMPPKPARVTPMPKYLFLRPDSHNWHVRFRYPDRVVEKSLRHARHQAGGDTSPPIHRAPQRGSTRREAPFRGRMAVRVPTGRSARWPERRARRRDRNRTRKFYGPDGKLLRTTPNGAPSVRIGNLQHRFGIPFVDDRMKLPRSLRRDEADTIAGQER